MYSAFAQSQVELEEYVQMRIELNDSITKLTNSLSKMGATNAILKDSVDDLLKYQTNLQSEINEIQGRKSEVERENKTLNSQKKEFRNEVNSLKDSIQTLYSINKNLVQETSQKEEELNRLRRELEKYEVMEAEIIEEVEIQVEAIISKPVLDLEDPKITTEEARINHFLRTFPNSESLNNSSKRLQNHIDNIKKYNQARLVAREEFNPLKVREAVEGLDKINKPAEKFQDLINDTRELIVNYCKIYREIKLGIDALDNYPPRIIKENQLNVLKEKSMEYPYLQDILKEKEKNLMEQGNPLKDIECD